MEDNVVKLFLVAGIILGVVFVTANSVGLVDQLTGTTPTEQQSPGSTQTYAEDGGSPAEVSSTDSGAVEIDDPPSEIRYVNVYEPKDPPRWIPERNLSLSELKRTRPGPVEVTRYPNVDPTAEHLDEAWEMYRKSYEAAEDNDWFSFEEGLDDGFRKYDFLHYKHPGYYLDNRSLDTYRPEALMYYPDPEDPENDSSKILAGFMYETTSLDAEGTQFGGPLTVWHYHNVPETCFEGVLSFSPTFEDYDCEGEPKRPRTAEMIHVWFVKNPEGPFASRMHMPREYMQEPEKMSEEEFKQYTSEAFERSRNPS